MLDRTDCRLLTLLQQNNRRTLRDLADDLEISPPTCLRRMRRLEQTGVIRGHTAVLDARRLGWRVRAYIEVSLLTAGGEDMRAFERRMRHCPEVIQCAEISGEVDYLLTVVARDMDGFGEFTRRNLADNRRVRTYRTMLVLKETKNEHCVPVSAA